MSIEKNRALAERFHVLLNGHELDALAGIIGENFIDHSAPPGAPHGLAGLRAFREMVRAAFPDIRAQVHELLADGDWVVARLTVSGTHRGMFQGVSATGKQVSIQVFDMLRIEDGRIVERRNLRDMLGLMQQLGVVPARPPAS